MSLFTARGTQAQESAKAKKVDLAKVFIRLKDGESVRIRLLGINESTVAEYKAQGDFNLGIYTQPDISPITGQDSPLTVASKSGIEKFKNLYAKKRYLFVFANIDTGELQVWDCSKTQGAAMLDLLQEYDEVRDSVAFTFKRTGTKVETSYNLMPIMKLKPEDKTKFDALENIEVPANFLEQVLIPRTAEQQIEALRQAGFPVEDFFNVGAGVPDGEKEDGIEGIEDETSNF